MALVGEGGPVCVQVQCRRGDTLYVNDGVYGSLSDAGALGFRFPARRIRLGKPDDAGMVKADFALFGPTCDSADRMRGPFRLPADMGEGGRYFTGEGFQDEVLVGQLPSRMRATVVSFTPGARTGWHAHPVGQTLYCLTGVGRICIAKAPGRRRFIPAARS